MKYEAIIFDVGDTLLESYPSEAQIYAERLQLLGFDIDDNTIATAISNASNAQIAREQVGAPRMSDEDFAIMLDLSVLSCVVPCESAAEYLEALRTTPLPTQELRVIDGATEALQSLQERGYRLAIVSNHRAWLPDRLTQLGLSGYFEAIVVSDLVGIEKPDPRIMQIALDKLNLDAPACLYVGDHPFDVLCAKLASLDCAWITAADSRLPESIPYKQNYHITRLTDLLALLN